MKLALGTVQFGLSYGIANRKGQVQTGEVKNILDYAKENKINVLDTASSYGNSEEILGSIGVNDYQIISKTTPFKGNIAQILDSFHYLNNTIV